MTDETRPVPNPEDQVDWLLQRAAPPPPVSPDLIARIAARAAETPQAPPSRRAVDARSFGAQSFGERRRPYRRLAWAGAAGAGVLAAATAAAALGGGHFDFQRIVSIPARLIQHLTHRPPHHVLDGAARLPALTAAPTALAPPVTPSGPPPARTEAPPPLPRVPLTPSSPIRPVENTKAAPARAMLRPRLIEPTHPEAKVHATATARRASIGERPDALDHHLDQTRQALAHAEPPSEGRIGARSGSHLPPLSEKPVEENPAYRKFAGPSAQTGARSAEARSAANRGSGERADGDKAAEERGSGGKGLGEKTPGDRTGGEKNSGMGPSENREDRDRPTAAERNGPGGAAARERGADAEGPGKKDMPAAGAWRGSGERARARGLGEGRAAAAGRPRGLLRRGGGPRPRR